MRGLLIIIVALALSSCQTLSPKKENDIDRFPDAGDWSRAGRTFVPRNAVIE